MNSRITAIVGLIVATQLSACAVAPLGPTVQATPAAGKSMEDFVQDRDFCRNFASGEVAGAVQQANNSAVNSFLAQPSGDQSASTDNSGGSAAKTAASQQPVIQKRYDDAYAQCMVQKGDQVAGYQPPAAAAPEPEPAAAEPAPAPEPAAPKFDRGLVMGVQAELIRIGLLSGTPDGKVGPRTKGAISDYQKTRGLPIDGKPTDALLDDLRKH